MEKGGRIKTGDNRGGGKKKPKVGPWGGKKGGTKARTWKRLFKKKNLTKGKNGFRRKKMPPPNSQEFRQQTIDTFNSQKDPTKSEKAPYKGRPGLDRRGPLNCGATGSQDKAKK